MPAEVEMLNKSRASTKKQNQDRHKCGQRDGSPVKGTSRGWPCRDLGEKKSISSGSPILSFQNKGDLFAPKRQRVGNERNIEARR